MKVLITTLLVASLQVVGVAQKIENLPLSSKVYDLDGNEKTIGDIVKNNGKLTIVDFWATWCKPCILEIKHITDVYDQWQSETGVKMALISVDNENMIEKIKQLAESKGWKYELYIDKGHALQKELNIHNVPQTYLVNESGKIFFEHDSFTPGDENKLYKAIKKN